MRIFLVAPSSFSRDRREDYSHVVEVRVKGMVLRPFPTTLSVDNIIFDGSTKYIHVAGLRHKVSRIAASR